MICINSITICPESVTITKGKWYYGAYVQVCPTNATCRCVTWHSSNSNVANVNQNGYIFGVSEGVAVIYATAQDGSGAVGFCNVTVVSPVKVSSVTITPSTKTVNVGDTVGLSATVCPTNAEDKRIRWTSCDCNVADVDYLTGCVTAKAAGTTCICANAVDGSGVQGCCEVTVNTQNIDSIGVFRNLSMLSATPSDTETGAPAMLGLQFRERQDGNHDIRLISQIKTLYYKILGFEIHSKYGDAAPVSNILCSKIVYTSLLADEETVYPNDGFDYFVVDVIENVPENTVASFKIVPFAITLEGEFLRGSTATFSFEGTEQCDYVDFEIPECLSTLDHIRVNTGNGSNLDVMSLPNENSTVFGQFANEKQIALVIDTPQNEKWYAVYGRTTDGTYEFGWCDGEYLQAQVAFIKSQYSGTLNIRPEPNTNYKELGYIVKDERVRLLGKNIKEDNSTRVWNKIEYLGIEAYVVEDGDFNDCKDWVYLIEGKSGYDQFLDGLAQRESSGIYGKVSSSGSYLGRYQMGADALTDAGFKKNGAWTTLAKKYGVTNNASFLSSPQGQEVAIRLFHAELWKQLLNHGAESVIGDSYIGVTITKSGLLAAAHLVGASGVMGAIQDNREIADANGTKATRYMSELMGYDISEIVHKK